MKNKSIVASRLAALTCALAFIVVMVGAYTRLTDAGLGCPDWPGCYNHLTVPETQTALQQAAIAFPNAPVHVIKAWTEMSHRYIAGILGLLIFTLGITAVVRRKKVKDEPLFIPFLLIALAIFQAFLGKWTVTMKLLPVIVMSHLLGGMAILSLLWFLNLKFGHYFVSERQGQFAKLRGVALLGLIVVAVQIFLGGWTSANYAALICPGFPYCKAHIFFPQSDFAAAFNFYHAFMHERLNSAALISIQMTHRIGALVTVLYVGALAIYLIVSKHAKTMRNLGFAMMIILLLQIMLGIINVVFLLPLSIAVLHNAFAALLLLSMVTLVFIVFSKQQAK